MIFFLLAAFALRIYGFDASAIWYDEVHSLFRATHPITYFNLWEVSLRMFAHGPLWLLRFPALLCAMGSLLFAWLIMDELEFNDAQRLTACGFLIAFPGLIWMSQDARYYAMISFASMITIYLALRRSWTFGLVFGLLYFIHPTAPAYGLAAFAIALLLKMDLKHFLVAVLSALTVHVAMNIVIAMIPSVPFTEGMCCLGHTQGWWLGSMTLPYSTYSLVQAFFVNTLPPLIMLIALVWISLVLIRAYLQFMQIPALLVIIPFTTIVITSAVYQNVFFYRPLMPLALPLSLWIGFSRDRVILAIGLALLLIGLIRFDPAARGAYVDLAASRIREAWQPGDRIIYENGLTAAPFDHYLGDLPSCVLSVELLPQGYPLHKCGADHTQREWLITTSTTPQNGILFDHLWPWQMQPIQIYLEEE